MIWKFDHLTNRLRRDYESGTTVAVLSDTFEGVVSSLGGKLEDRAGLEQFIKDNQSDIDNSDLVIVPYGGGNGYLPALKPFDRSGDLTWSRPSGVQTRVNSNGFIESVPYNLAQYSGDFTNSSWSKIAVTPSFLSDSSPASNKPTLLSGNGSNSAHILNQNKSFVAGEE